MHRREVHYQVGNQVYLKLQAYKLRSLAKKSNEKMQPHFYGPILVNQKVGQVAYRLELPLKAHINSVFHFPYLGSPLLQIL